MKIYNSMTGKKEEFKPIKEGEVKMYACGITVYDLSHIGHARQAIVYSMIRDYFKYRGYKVERGACGASSCIFWWRVYLLPDCEAV